MKKFSILLLLLALFSVISIQAQVDRTKAPEAGPATKLDFGKSTKFTLKNGLKVIVVENHRLPVVSYSLMLDIDPIYEGNKAGYLNITGDLLRRGTTNLTKAQLDEKVDFIGASLNTSSTVILGRSLKKHSDELLSLMTDILYHPSFSQEELDKLKKQTLVSIKTNKDDIVTIGANINEALIFGKNTASGEIATEKTINNITIEDCKNYYKTYFRPNVAYLVIVGDVTVKEAKKIVNKNFSQWKKKAVPSHKFVTPKPITKPIYAIANKDASTQSYITVTYPVNLKPGAPDVLNAVLMNSVFGYSGFIGRLFQNLREKHAWTYGAYANLRPGQYSGLFQAYSKVRGNVTDSAFTQIKYEMNRIIKEKITEKELKTVKNVMAGDFGRSLTQSSTIASFALNIDKYNLPTDYYENYMKRLEAITVKDVQAAAIKYMKPENAVYLAVGDISVIKPLMNKFANGAKVTEYNYYANKVKHSKVLPTGLTAKKVIENYVNSIGGADKLKQIKDCVVKSTVSIKGMKLAMSTYKKDSKKLCIEMKMGANILSKQVYDGKVAKMTAQGHEKMIQGKMLDLMKYQAILYPELSYAASGYKLKLAGIDKVDGSDAYKVIITAPTGDATVTYFNAKTGYKVKEVVKGKMGTSITTYGNYKDFDGVKQATTLTQSAGSQILNITVDEVLVNKGINDSVFK